MVSVTKLTGRAADILAYAKGGHERVPRGDYYLGVDGQELDRARVQWSPTLTGNGLVGLEGEVRPEAFEAVMGGVDPRTGEQVVRARLRVRQDVAGREEREAAYAHASALGVSRRRHRSLTIAEAAALQRSETAAEASDVLRAALQREKRGTDGPPAVNRVAGHDITMSAPKSISVAWGLTTDPQLRAGIEAAHVAATRRSLEELQARALVGRAGKERTRVPLQWVGIEATHMTARQSHEAAREGRPPDPDLHTHVVVANMGWDEAAQKWRAVDAGTLLHMRSLADGVYLTELAAQLQSLGFAVEPNTGRDGRYLELRGVATAWNEAFASRAHEVRRARELLGIENDVQARALAAATRRGKGEDAHGDHTAAWREHLRRSCGDAAVEQLDVALRERTPAERMPLAQREAALLERFFGPEGLCAHEASHTPVAVEATLWHLNGGRLSAAEMADLVPRVMADDRLVLLDDGRLSTNDLLRQEVAVERTGRWLLGSADAGRRAEPELVARAIAAVEAADGLVLDAEQRHAVAVLTDPSRRFAMMGGRAGTGKTTTMRAAREVWEAQGREVVVVSVAAATAQRSAREIGAAQGMTFEAFAGRRRSGVLHDAETRRLVVVVDEAAMADTPRLASLLSAAGDATVIGLGDQRQLQAVGAGGAWVRLRRHAEAANGYCELMQVHRQRREWERTALDELRQGRGAEALASYLIHDRVHVAPTRAEARRQVAEAWNRARLVGERAGRPIADFVMVAATREDVAVLNSWAQGMRLRDGELGAGIDVVDAGRRAQLHRGDRVRLEAVLDSAHPNGIRGTVTDIATESLRIEWDGGHHAPTLYRPAEHTNSQPLQLDYAGTAQRTQGTTAEQAFVLPSPQQRLEAVYSAFARARDETSVWLDATTWRERVSELQPAERRVVDDAEVVARLARSASQSEPKTAALEVGVARVDGARARMEAYQRAVDGTASRESAVAAPEQPVPTLEELRAKIQVARERATTVPSTDAGRDVDRDVAESVRRAREAADRRRRREQEAPRRDDDDRGRGPGREL